MGVLLVVELLKAVIQWEIMSQFLIGRKDVDSFLPPNPPYGGLSDKKNYSPIVKGRIVYLYL
jgi:hypothetical protein